MYKNLQFDILKTLLITQSCLSQIREINKQYQKQLKTI